MEQELLFEIILAANFLDIKPMLYVRLNDTTSSSDSLSYSDVGCKHVAGMIKGKSPEEISKLFNITSDFTPEEAVSSPNVAVCSCINL